MKSVQVYDIKGKAVGKFTLDEAYFNGKVNKALLHQAVLMYLANLRKGSASTKTRGEVSGGGRKPWRQKGTGRARAGSIRSPLWRGGGVVFGPHPRDFSYNLPKRIKRLALQQSLNDKAKDEGLLIVDEIALQEPKTKEFVSFLTAIKAKRKSLVVIEKEDLKVFRASRNIPGVSVKTFNQVNAYDVMKHYRVIFTKQALENLIKLRKNK